MNPDLFGYVLVVLVFAVGVEVEFSCFCQENKGKTVKQRLPKEQVLRA